jgi:DNA repair exonuclease SbcCD ATPase subunit
MIKFNTLTLKNFMSIGAITQAVQFPNHDLTLIVGENLDLGGQGNKNGVGKTAILNGLSFALYGTPLFQIKKDLLINDINQKALVVSVNYEVDGKFYKIERGRKPNFLRFYVNGGLVKSPDEDETAGESKWTQAEIQRSVSHLSHDLFKYIIALHTKITPFLSMREKEQRELIEELFSIAQLSEKAEVLKEQAKNVKDAIRVEETRIKTLIDSNEKIQRHITDLRFKASVWDRSQASKIDQLKSQLAQLSVIDADQEIFLLKQMAEWEANQKAIRDLHHLCVTNEALANKYQSEATSVGAQLKSLHARVCPMCGQLVQDDKANQLKTRFDAQISASEMEKARIDTVLIDAAAQLEAALNKADKMDEPKKSIYPNLEAALNHRHSLERISADLRREEALDNPYIEQIANLNTSAIQEVSYDYLNTLSKLKDHQEFLLKLLTSRESFIRKKIIDQNLSHLNSSLSDYLTQLNLQHRVTFTNDLSVDITKLGKEYDYDQLSSGQAKRLILALSWAFRDVWESTNQNINLLMIDELIDSGLDTNGTDAALELLRQMAREKQKNIFLISHKEGLEEKVDDVLHVQMENSFTSFSDTVLEM